MLHQSRIGFCGSLAVAFICLHLVTCVAHAQVPEDFESLTVDETGHFLVTESGKPFFWLGDTAWQLFATLDREEVLRYLEDRKSKQFNVIQAHLLDWDIENPNAYGHRPFHDRDSDQPNEEYWEHADFIVQQATSQSLYVALLPAWAGAHIESKRNRPRRALLTDAGKAYRYGRFVASRYGDLKNIIWILGGDTRPTRHEIYDQLARGIIDSAGEGDPDNVLLSYHPPGGTHRPPATSSGEFYHDKPWLDFNMIQSGHSIGNRNYERIGEDYRRTPTKPTLDAEPCYEHHPVKHKFENGEFSAWHLRRRAYWSILAGAFGYTYGGNGIWQMDQPGNVRKSHHNYFWYDALDFEGAGQMAFVRQLFESRTFWMPDQSIILSDEGTVDDRVQAARASDHSYWIIYVTNGRTVDLDVSKVSGTSVIAWWFNPRDGRTYSSQTEKSNKPFKTLRNVTSQKFDPPGSPHPENDWILVLDDASKSYPTPGTVFATK